VNADGGEGFEICLDAGTATTVRAGDRQSDGHLSKQSHTAAFPEIMAQMLQGCAKLRQFPLDAPRESVGFGWKSVIKKYSDLVRSAQIYSDLVRRNVAWSNNPGNWSRTNKG
jgi:hypothetical protein